MTETGLERFSGWQKRATNSDALEDCSLVIATYQRPKELLLLLKTMVASADVPSEVVIVDGSPSQDVAREVREWSRVCSLPFELIYVKSPAGLTRQRNVGIDVSSREIIFFMDDDCLPEPGYFREIRRVFKADAEHKIGAACGLLMNEIDHPISLRWRLRLALRLVPRVDPGIYHPSGTSVPRALTKAFTGVRPTDTLCGCAMAFRREVLDRHRFSEFFYGYSQGEDLEMSLRVRRDWKIVWCGDARAVHNHASGGRPTSFRKGLMEVRNRHFIWRRHAQKMRFSDHLRFWLDMLFLVVMDLGWFIFHPTQPYALRHALGVAYGTLCCIFSPTRYDEPPARKQYAFSPTSLEGSG